MYDDCFAKKPMCSLLSYVFCEKGKECPFYKSQEQFDEDLKQYPELDNKEVAARHSAAIDMEGSTDGRKTNDK